MDTAEGACWRWGGPLLLEEGEAEGQQLRDSQLWLALGLRKREKLRLFSSSEGAAAWEQKGNNSGFGPACG